MKKSNNKTIGYAVVGLGSIAQMAVLPAFQHAKKNSRLTALVSDDPVKLKKLGKRYGVSLLYSYEQYDQCLKSDEVDAVYIALPNTMHSEYAARAARVGVHVLCEKPMATNAKECDRMIDEAKKNKVQLMVAYRLHFEKSNLDAVKLINSGKIGAPRYFRSSFSRQIEKGDIRLKDSLGGGSVWDMGIYCLNAARYLFKAEPTHATAVSASGADPRFTQVDEMTSVILQFPGGRLATFTSSFGASDTSSYEVVGTKGVLKMEPGYDYALGLKRTLTINGKPHIKSFSKTDQFAPELIYFSNHVLNGTSMEPSGVEGRTDVKIIEAIYESAKTGRTIEIEKFAHADRPSPKMEMTRPPVDKPELVHVSG
jgi:glucose-fructose oxidoreductase